MKSQLELAETFLKQAQQPDGSWPYSAGKQSYPEPAAFSLMALALAEKPPQESLSRGLTWLESLINTEGAIVLPGDTEPHWSTAQTLLALVQVKAPEEIRERCAQWLLKREGRKVDPDPNIPLNVNFRGWPWVTNTFTWVEPTTHAMFALKAAGYASHERLAEAESLLLDRTCRSAGWNYGNYIVLDRELPPFTYTTSLALIALQHRRTEPAVIKALDYLQKELHNRQSTLSLAYAILCLQIYELPTEKWVDDLLKRQESDGSWRHEIHLTAIAVLALRCVTEARNVYRS